MVLQLLLKVRHTQTNEATMCTFTSFAPALSMGGLDDHEVRVERNLDSAYNIQAMAE
jgi:hypothetical protein